MVFKLTLFALFAISLAANIWLWGHWNFSEQDYRLSLTLVVGSLALVYVTIYPLVRFTMKGNFFGVFKLWRYRIAYGLAVLSTIILAIATFWWMRAYLLPVQIGFVAINAFLFAQRRGWIGSKSPKSSDGNQE